MRTSFIAAILCLAFALSSICWFAFDHNWPSWDGAEHLFSSFYYAVLWHRFRPFSPQWIHAFLTVNYLYPLLVHAFNGLLKSCLGMGRWVDGLSLVIFGIILNLSVFALAQLLFEDVPTAAITVVLINFFPLVSALSHVSLLDFPYLALHCLAILAIVWWWKSPTVKRAAAAGAATALALSSKQIAAMYLIGPCLALWFWLLARQQWHRWWQLNLIGVMGAAALLLWLLPNFYLISGYVHWVHNLNNELSIRTAHANISFFSRLWIYITSLPVILSLLLLTVAVIGCFSLNRTQWKQLWIPVTASACGVLLISLIGTISLPELRYIVQVALPAALICSLFLVRLLKSTRRFSRITACTVLVLAGVQYVLVNFTPYPITVASRASNLALQLAGQQSVTREYEVLHYPTPILCPTPSGDVWGQEWIIEKIAAAQRAEQTRTQLLHLPVIYVTPNTRELSALQYTAFCHGLLCDIASPRVWVPGGDTVHDMHNDTSSGKLKWIIVKTGYQGMPLVDSLSIDNYRRGIYLIEHGGQYRLFACRTIADGSLLQIYRLASTPDKKIEGAKWVPKKLTFRNNDEYRN